VIPSFSKKGDLILVDECAGEPIISGTFLARSTVQRFKHNDMEDLRTILESIAADDKRLRRDPTQQRRFIIVEGLYRNVGDLCPLPEIVALKNQV
jgi:serine palmitoyltransferase